MHFLLAKDNDNAPLRSSGESWKLSSWDRKLYLTETASICRTRASSWSYTSAWGREAAGSPGSPFLRISPLLKTVWVPSTEALFNCARKPQRHPGRYWKLSSTNHVGDSRSGIRRRNDIYLHSCSSDRWAQRVQATHRHAGMVSSPRSWFQFVCCYIHWWLPES